VTISEALDAIADQAHHPSMKAVVTDLSMQVKGGVAFSSALERSPRVFSRLFVALMRASEASGSMGTMLQRASDYLKQERETVKRVKGAMIYPICMLSFCALVVIGLLVFILPRFEKIYAGKGAILPLPTRILLGISHVLIGYWPLVLAGLVGAIVGLCFFFRCEAGKKMLDTVRIRMPLIGKMYRKAYLARSLRTMATMVSTGVNVLEGLAITAKVAGNRHYEKIWKSVAEHAREGSSLSEELGRHALIPPTVSHMVAAGEKAGKLANVMERVADFCDEDVKVAVKAVTSLIEPAMIITMGLLIGGIAMALLLPVFSLSSLVSK
jgi:type IV pilus assembly protein PilC